MVPLIARSHFSLLRGTASVADLCRAAVECGFQRIALTDTDNLYGLWEYLRYCRRNGMKPIIGAEITDPVDRSSRAVCLTLNTQGFRNLCRLLSRRHLDQGFRLSTALPGLDEGLIVLTSSEVLLQGWAGLGNYVYIPLGGNRKGEARTLANILLLFIVCGLWHGAAWSFVLWGGLTGLASIVYRLWTKTGLKLPKAIAWIVYFGFFNISAVFFRAQTWPDTVKVLKGMLGLSGIYVSPNLADNPFWQKLTVIGIRFGEWRENLPDTDTYLYFLCFLLIPFVLLTKNSNELLEKFSPNWKNAMAVSLMMIAGLLLLNKTSSFLYFNF